MWTARSAHHGGGLFRLSTKHTIIDPPRSELSPLFSRFGQEHQSQRPLNVECQAEGSSSNGSAPHEDSVWQLGAFPQYLQPNPVGVEFCANWEDAKEKQGISNPQPEEHSRENCSLWRTIHRETEEDAKIEPLLSSSLYASILSHDTFEHSLAFVLANRLSDATMLSTELFELFYSILKGSRYVAEAALADLCAVRERDPACATYAQALLYFKGYHAIQVQRIAHELWQKGRAVMALALQSRASEVFAVDIHPAAKIGKGVLLDHGTGVVIGETAEIGNNVSILQNVTLGGTGKEHGDRHPKISDNVLIGASATILGNIRIGKGSQVAAGSLVLKPVPPRTMVAGSPAKEVGKVSGNPAAKMEHWCQPAIIQDWEPCDNLYTTSDAKGQSSSPSQTEASASAATKKEIQEVEKEKSVAPVAAAPPPVAKAVPPTKQTPPSQSETGTSKADTSKDGFDYFI